MDPSREAGTLSSKLDAAWDRRQREAADWNRRLAAGEISPSMYRRMKWFFKALKRDSHGKGSQNFSERRSAMEREWRDVTGVKQPSLAWSLNDTFGWHFWAGGLFKVSKNFQSLIHVLLTKPVLRPGCW